VVVTPIRRFHHFRVKLFLYILFNCYFGMRSKKTTSKINFYFTLLELFKKDKTTSEIAKELNISKQKLYYHTRRLRDLGFLEKKGYGVWEVKRSKKIDLEHTIKWREKKVRGHAFIWKVKLQKEFDWETILKRNKIPYKLIRGYTPRIFVNNKKVWLGKESIIIYENKSFYENNAINSRKYAIYELLSTLNDFSKKVKVNIGKYYFKPTREHYGLIKNELARQCNKKGEKIIVRDGLDGEWLWIDDSEGMFGELETGGKGVTKDRAGLNLDVQKWYNDHKSHNFKVTPSFLLESISGLVQTQQMNAENIKKHMDILDTMKETLKKIQESLEK
jgi:predicted DNA-binding protein YlxM (UPF0122 family)